MTEPQFPTGAADHKLLGWRKWDLVQLIRKLTENMPEADVRRTMGQVKAYCDERHKKIRRYERRPAGGP